MPGTKSKRIGTGLSPRLHPPGALGTFWPGGGRGLFLSALRPGQIRRPLLDPCSALPCPAPAWMGSGGGGTAEALLYDALLVVGRGLAAALAHVGGSDDQLLACGHVQTRHPLAFAGEVGASRCLAPCHGRSSVQIEPGPAGACPQQRLRQQPDSAWWSLCLEGSASLAQLGPGQTGQVCSSQARANVLCASYILTV